MKRGLHRGKRQRTPEVWVWREPSSTCEYRPTPDKACGNRACAAYPAMGGGYHSLCAQHMTKHLDYCVTIAEAQRGLLPKYAARSTPTSAGGGDA